MHELLHQQEDRKDQLKILPQLKELQQWIQSLSKNHDIYEILNEYIEQRIFYTTLKEDRHSNAGEQQKIKTLTTGEKLAKYAPELKKLIDHIVEDIHKHFKIQLKKKPKPPTHLEKNPHYSHQDIIHAFNGIDNAIQITDKDISNLALCKEDDERDDITINQHTIRKIIPRQKKNNKPDKHTDKRQQKHKNSPHHEEK